MNDEDLPPSLRIPNEHLKTCLRSIIDAAKVLWDSPLLQHYTKHGLDHSKRIIEIIGKLLDFNPTLLNVHERFILLASVYLHDIGMQSPSHAGLSLRSESEYTNDEKELIREKHNESSYEMILESISQGSKISLGLERCERYANYIATLSRYHRKLNIKDVKDTSLAGEDIRLPLLISLLRLGDELDQDCRRVNMDILKLRDIPVESKFYWWSHHYVGSVRIKNGEIELYFTFPIHYRGDKKIEVFRKKVYESVEKQLAEVYDILYNNGLKLNPYVKIKDDNYASDGVVASIPNDLSEYIDENILKTTEIAQNLSKTTGVNWIVDGVPYSDDARVVKCLTNVIKLVSEGKNLDAAQEIERCRNLVMAPKEKMIFLNSAGSCYYILGNLSKAKDYYEDVLKISGRSDLQKIYKEDVLSARAAGLGNIGLIYSDKGELDEALKYLTDALAIDKEIGYKQGEAADLGNIGLILKAKGELDKALKYLTDALAILNKHDLVYGKDIVWNAINSITKEREKRKG